MFFKYTDSKLFIENIANASLYSAICPPVFLKENLPVERSEVVLHLSAYITE